MKTPQRRSRRAIARHVRNTIEIAKATNAIVPGTLAADRTKKLALHAIRLAKYALAGERIAPNTPASTKIWGLERTAHNLMTDMITTETPHDLLPNLEYGATYGSALGDKGWTLEK